MIKVNESNVLNNSSTYWKLLILYFVPGTVLGGGHLAMGGKQQPVSLDAHEVIVHSSCCHWLPKVSSTCFIIHLCYMGPF